MNRWMLFFKILHKLLASNDTYLQISRKARQGSLGRWRVVFWDVEVHALIFQSLLLIWLVSATYGRDNELGIVTIGGCLDNC